MKTILFYIWRTMKELGLALAFMAIIIVGTFAVLLGFRDCWQCKRIGHYSVMRKYWTWHDRKKPVDVCEACFEMLRESDEEGFI